jgi:S1-C subfamily serine protease
MHLMSNTRLSCPSCRAALKLAAPVAPGKRVQCPRCSQVFISPAPGSQERPPLAAVSRVEPATGKSACSTLLLFGAIGCLLAVGSVALLLWQAGSAWKQIISLGSPAEGVAASKKYSSGASTDFNSDDWLGDFVRAKKQAQREHKDLLVQVDSYRPFRAHRIEPVLSSDEFEKQVRRHFVLAQSTSSIPAPATVRKARHWQSDPADLVLTDAEGKPYAVVRQLKERIPDAVAQIEKLRSARSERDGLFKAVRDASGPGRLAAARKALDYCEHHDLTIYEGPLLAEWREAAQKGDPKNTSGDLEAFFEANWYVGLWNLKNYDRSEIQALTHRLDEWKGAHRFQDVNRGAGLNYVAGMLTMHHESTEDAARYFRDGIACKPTDRVLQQRLAMASARVHGGSSGTGFVAAADGYVLTNHHVVSGNGKLEARLPGIENPVAVEVIARDEGRDLALVKIAAPSNLRLSAVPLATDSAAQRGEQVAVLGYPLGDYVGGGLKLTTGVVSAMPEAGNGFMLMLDAKVNPGNSGGPVCDAYGRVVGIVTAKSLRGSVFSSVEIDSPVVESYGMAIPAKDVESFLKANLPAYQAPKAARQKMSWNEVDSKVSSSVVMITQSEG